MKTILFHFNKTKKFFFIMLAISLIITLVLLLIYPVFINHKDSFLIFETNSYLKNMLKVNIDTLFTPLGYYCLIFPILSIIASILSLSLGIDLTLYDRAFNLMENINYRPISKRRILRYKMISNIIEIFIYFIILHLLTLLLLSFYLKLHYSLKLLFFINFSLMLLMLVFYSIGALIGSLLKKYHIAPITTITILFFEGLHLLENAFKLTFLKYINPYSYFEIMDIINLGKYQPRFLVISTILFFFFISFAFGNYLEENN